MGSSTSVELPRPMQSVEYFENLGPVHRHPNAVSGLLGVWDPKITTLAEAWSLSVSRYGDRPFLGTRPVKGDTAGDYVFKSYNEINHRVQNLAAGYRALGLSAGNCIGVYSSNNEHWICVEQACYQQSMLVVSIYDTLGADSVQYVLAHAEIPLVFCHPSKLKNVLSVLDRLPALRYVVTFGEVQEDDRALCEQAGRRLMSIAELEAMGKAAPVSAVLPQPQDLCTIMYTSGTTGDPKGVMLTHANLIATLAGAVNCGLNVTEKDVHLSYLPMAHIFERIVMTAVFSFGACAGFFQGDPKKLVADLQALKPTLFFGVPRVFNLLYDRVRQGVEAAGGLKRFLFNMALSAKLDALSKGLDTPRWNRLVFHKIRDSIVGPRVRMVISGSAPLSENVQNFLRCIFCCPVMQGYGLTESGAAVTLQSRDDVHCRRVGGPLPCSELRLEDVPEMGYLSSNPVQQGEVLIRGLNLFKGYFKNEEETRKVITPDGWFHSGDVGQWNPDGTLSIIDRRKNIFKLSQGEYIASEKLEMVFAQSAYVGQIWITGKSDQNCIVTVIVPNFDNLVKAVAEMGLTGSATDEAFMKQLCANPKVKKLILDDITRLGKEAKLAGFEFPKAVHLDHQMWTVDNGMLTAAFKIKRPTIAKYYKDVIDGMYDAINKAAASAGPAA